jgi:hypothetical protein
VALSDRQLLDGMRLVEQALGEKYPPQLGPPVWMLLQEADKIVKIGHSKRHQQLLPTMGQRETISP